MPLDPKTRLEIKKQLDALKRIVAFEEAFEQHDTAAMIEAAGIPYYLLKDMSYEDIADAVNVRMADIYYASGLRPLREDEK